MLCTQGSAGGLREQDLSTEAAVEALLDDFGDNICVCAVKEPDSFESGHLRASRHTHLRRRRGYGMAISILLSLDDCLSFHSVRLPHRLILNSIYPQDSDIPTSEGVLESCDD